MPDTITLTPESGVFDVDRIRDFVEAHPEILLDPCGSGTYLVGPAYGPIRTRARLGAERLKDPTRFPYTCLIEVRAEAVVVWQEFADADKRAIGREVMRFVLEQHRCRIQDDYLRDITDGFEV